MVGAMAEEVPVSEGDSLRESPAVAMALLRAGRSPDAMAMFERLLAISPNDPLALHGKSRILAEQGDLASSLILAKAAVQAAPGHPGLRYALANLLVDTKDFSGARREFESAIALQPQFFEAWNNLGLLLQDMKSLDEAEQAFRRALQIRPGAPGASNNLATVLIAKKCYRDAYDLLSGQKQPGNRPLWHRLAQRLAMSNQTDAALHLYRQLASSSVSDWLARLNAGLTLPVVPASSEALMQARSRYASGLATLHFAATPDVLAQADRPVLLEAVERDNFLLAYHGEDDKALQTGYGELVGRFIGAALPELRQVIVPRDTFGRKIRVGFASSFIRDCTVGHYFCSWMTQLDRSDFEVEVFILGGPDDALTAEIRAAVTRCERIEGTLPEVAQRIFDAGLDVLIYPELGMNDRALALAGLRLAPIQCAAWGHPLTTGFETIDVYFSCTAMEPEDAARHYSERLLLLPGLGTCYIPPEPPETIDRKTLGLPEEGTLLFFPHSLFKIHPDDDGLLVSVLRANPDTTAVLFDAEHPEVTRDYRIRLTARMRSAGVDDRRVLFLPLMPRSRFLQVCGHCAAMLDCLRWSGGNTSIDALSMGVPVLTKPGTLMRSRQTAGMLRMMGITELIAGPEKELLMLASRVLSSPDWRQELSARIVEQRSVLFNDLSPIRALEKHLRQMTGSGRVVY